jgi:hypothetical protein
MRPSTTDDSRDQWRVEDHESVVVSGRPSPTTQGKRFDPYGDYVRRWVPELAPLDEGHIHEPHQKKSATLFGDVNYPQPIVEHSREREESLARYRLLRTLSTSPDAPR